MQSKKWRNITILNGVLFLAAVVFFFVRDNQYFRAYEYFGESAYNSQYWLHPQNNWIERISFKDSGNGFIQDFRPSEDGGFNLQLLSNNQVKSLKLKNEDIFLKTNGETTIEVEMAVFALSLNKDKQISFECSGIDLENLFCTYFIND